MSDETEPTASPSEPTLPTSGTEASRTDAGRDTNPAPPLDAGAAPPSTPAAAPPELADALSDLTEALTEPGGEAPDEPPSAQQPAAEQPAPAQPAQQPAAEQPAPAQPAQQPAAEQPAPAQPAQQPAAEQPAPAAETRDPNAPPPKPGEPGYDPDEGLGLVESTTILGPPNMGGYESGEIVTGTVLTVNPREAEVDLGGGKVGVISDRHWASGTQVDLTSVLQAGDSVESAVLARADVKKRITLSHLWAQQKRGWEAAEAAAKGKSNLTGTVTETVKGGLSLDVNGVRAFMPASLVDVTTVSNLEPLIGETFEVRVIEADRTKQRLIVSRKAALRASQRQQAKEALAGFEVGQRLSGVVAQITDFGAFVDVEGVRGLVHKSEVGWSRARDPQRDLTVGQPVEVTVIKVQPSRNRLGLSMKTGTDPLVEVRKGDRYEGTVSRLVDFGAFVLLPSGLEGLVHVSEMAEYRVFAPEEIVIPGERVWVKVLKVDRKRRTIDLSMAQAVVPDPPEEAAALAAEAEVADAAAASPGGDDYAEDQAETDDGMTGEDE